ncbi:2220_t:CDS:2, partial [Funneliformis geosporum]
IYDPLNDGRNVIYDPVNDDDDNGIYDPGKNEIYVDIGTSVPFSTTLRGRSGEPFIKKQLVGYGFPYPFMAIVRNELKIVMILTSKSN